MLRKRNLGVLMALAIIIAFGFIACDELEGGDAIIGSIGPGGGRIFYYDPEGFNVEGIGLCYYLEVAPQNSSNNAHWGLNNSFTDEVTTLVEESIDHPLAKKIGNGWKDTQLIVAFNDNEGLTGTAAQLAAAADFGGFDDWFLPSVGEMYLLLLNKNKLGITIDGFFWTSTQYTTSNSACDFDIDYIFSETNDGNQGNGPIGWAGKGVGDHGVPVRAIRAGTVKL